MHKFSSIQNLISVILIASLLFSCEDEFKTYPTINYIPCEETNILEDPKIITDFECQANFNLTNVETIRNPSETPLNSSKFVGLFNDTEGAYDFLEIDFGNPINLTTNTVFKIKVKTEITGELKVMLDGGTSEPVFYTQNVIGNNGWYIYSFDFSWHQNENHSRIKIFFNNGVEITDGLPNLYYIDDLVFDLFVDPCEFVNINQSILHDFECQNNYELITENNNILTVNNIYSDEINSSIYSGAYYDDATNTSDAINIDLGDSIDFFETPQLHIKIYATNTGPLLARLSGENSSYELSNEINVTDEWVNYIFDFSNSDNDQTNLKIFFNYGVSDGSESNLFYIDDIMFLAAPCDEALVENCENTVADYNIISDWNCQLNYGIETTIPIVSNPLINCDNRSSNVGEYTDNGTEAYDAFILDYNEIINLSTHNKLKFKIYSSSSIQVLAKLEGGSAIEKWSDFTLINSWQEYSYDFSDAIENGNTTLVLFFNAGQTNGTNQDKYYIDDLRWDEN